MNSFILKNNVNADFYHSQTRYPPHLALNPSTLPPPLFSPYPYFYSNNFLAKPMPLMGPANPGSPTGAVPAPAYILPPDVTHSAFHRNQTYPSPPSSTSPAMRTNNTHYQNGHRKKSSHDQTSPSSDTSKMTLSNFLPAETANYSTPIRSKLRLALSQTLAVPKYAPYSFLSSTNGASSEQHRKLFIGGLSFKYVFDSLCSVSCILVMLAERQTKH